MSALIPTAPSTGPDNFVVRLLGWLLSAPGVIYLATRYGTTRVRGWALNGSYLRGRWSCGDGGLNPTVTAVIARHSGNGSLLELGCGTGRLIASLPSAFWRSYLGIDLSDSALAKARHRELKNARFVKGDFEVDIPEGPFDLIIGMESLYYIGLRRQPTFIRALVQRLAPGGKLLATFANPHRSRHLIALLEQQLRLEERGSVAKGRREYLVFARRQDSDVEADIGPIRAETRSGQ